MINSIKKFLAKKSNSCEYTVKINTIDELDNFFHQQAINGMQGKSSKKIKLILGDKLKNMGNETLHEILMMMMMSRITNDPDLNNKSNDGNSSKENRSVENIIYPLIWDKNATYH